MLTPAQGKESTDKYMEKKSWDAEALFLWIPDAHALALSLSTSQESIKRSHIQNAALQYLCWQQRCDLFDIYWSSGKLNAANSKLQKDKAKEGKHKYQHHEAGGTEKPG